MGFVIKNDDEWKPEESKYNQPKKTETEPEKKDAKEDPKWLAIATVVNCGMLNTRTEPNGSIIGQIKHGTNVCIWQELDHWSCVSVMDGSKPSDASVWVNSNYLQIRIAED